MKTIICVQESFAISRPNISIDYDYKIRPFTFLSCLEVTDPKILRQEMCKILGQALLVDVATLSSHIPSCPTVPFTASEPQNQETNEFHVAQKPLETNFKAPKM